MSLTKMVNGKKIELTPQEEAQIKAEWLSNEAESNQNSYKAKRLKDYPSINEQLEALWDIVKILQDQKLDIGIEGGTLLKKIEDVKKKYPKPN